MGKGLSAVNAMQDKDYRAESDARCLIEAEHVKADPARLKAAKNAAKKMAEDAMKAVAAAKQVSG